MSNFPSPTCLSPTNFLRSSGLNIYMLPRFSQHLLACILSQDLNPPTLCLSAASGIHFLVPKTSPMRLSAFFCMYLHLVSMSRLHPSSLNNFLRSSCFNIELSLPPMCLSIACIHFASYVDFPHWPLHHFLRFVVSISEPPLHQQLLACILSQYLNSSHPVLGPKKHAQVQEKKAPRSKNIQPNLSAYNNGVPPHPMEARSTKQVRGPKKKKPMSETINLAV